ncbi:MAG: ABC transporter ATP-binding protein [Candidatus Omnitrophota bacterium]
MLELNHLTCGYGRKFSLQDIDIKVEDKELIGIIGPNGSGKTTLLRAVTRILRPEKGTVFLEGRNIWEMKFKELARKVAVVPQGFGGLDMGVEDFVLLGRIPHLKRFQFFESKGDSDTVERCMNLTDTIKLRGQLMSEISGGERQLVLIARALTQEPRLLVLDEPTNHLDITHQIAVLDLIKRLNKELGLTVIIILHDLNLASEYCQRLVLINKGRIYKTGSPYEVLDYKIIEEVYKTIVVVQKNPISFKPYVLIVPEEERRKRGER